MGPKAETFTYDVSKFDVVFDGTTYHAAAMPPYTFTFAGGFSDLPATPVMADGIRPKFRDETQIGADKESVAAGQTMTPNFRFAIYVHSKLPVDAAFFPTLEIDSAYPHVMVARNQPPTVFGNGFTDNEAQKADLPTTCRPPAR